MFNGKRESTDAGVSARSGATGAGERPDGAKDRRGSGIGLSKLTRWLGKERDVSEPNEVSVDLHADMKRLRRAECGSEAGA